MSVKSSNVTNVYVDPLKFSDPFLEEISISLPNCVKAFESKGGALHVIEHVQGSLQGPILLRERDALYPICSEGRCRSQALYVVLNQLIGKNQLILFPPHGSRFAYDPYNGKIPSSKCFDLVDEFEAFYGHSKMQRFGEEFVPEWKKGKSFIQEDQLTAIKEFYDHHYYGPQSHFNNQKADRRVYIAFARPVHAVLKRLIETNQSLHNVTLVAIPLEDEITHPPTDLKVLGRSQAAYQAFTKKLNSLFKLHL